MKFFREKIELQYRPRLYLSEGLDEKNLKRLKRKISKGKGSCAVILLSENADDMFDIVTPFQLKLPVWEGKKPIVAGIAGSKDVRNIRTGEIGRSATTRPVCPFTVA